MVARRDAHSIRLVLPRFEGKLPDLIRHGQRRAPDSAPAQQLL